MATGHRPVRVRVRIFCWDGELSGGCPYSIGFSGIGLLRGWGLISYPQKGWPLARAYFSLRIVAILQLMSDLLLCDWWHRLSDLPDLASYPLSGWRFAQPYIGMDAVLSITVNFEQYENTATSHCG